MKSTNSTKANTSSKATVKAAPNAKAEAKPAGKSGTDATKAEKAKANREALKAAANTAAEIGIAADSADKAKVLTKAAKDKDSGAILKVLCTLGLRAHTAAASVKTLTAAKVPEAEAAEYNAKVIALYTAAARYADCVRNPEAHKAAEAILFTEWRGFLKYLAAEKVSASPNDGKELYRAITRTAREGISHNLPQDIIIRRGRGPSKMKLLSIRNLVSKQNAAQAKT